MKAASSIVAAVATIPAGLAFLFLRVLIKVVPRPGPKPKRTPRSTWAGRSVVALFVWSYRRSWFGRYLNRDGSRCCFIPSCTEYTERAVASYGLWRGLILAGDRFRRCAPSYPGSRIDFP